VLVLLDDAAVEQGAVEDVSFGGVARVIELPDVGEPRA
jgi:hypothetical protein